VVKTEITIFWIVALCNVVVGYHRFRGPLAFNHCTMWHDNPENFKFTVFLNSNTLKVSSKGQYFCIINRTLQSVYFGQAVTAAHIFHCFLCTANSPLDIHSSCYSEVVISHCWILTGSTVL